MFKVLQVFAFAADGMNTRLLEVGETVEITADLVEGLVAAGMIEPAIAPAPVVDASTAATGAPGGNPATVTPPAGDAPAVEAPVAIVDAPTEAAPVEAPAAAAPAPAAAATKKR